MLSLLLCRCCCCVLQAHAASTASDRYLVLLDAAAFLPTHSLDLTAHPADFVVASFYKMFGFPTGLGALVLRTELVPHLNKVGASWHNTAHTCTGATHSRLQSRSAVAQEWADIPMQYMALSCAYVCCTIDTQSPLTLHLGPACSSCCAALLPGCWCWCGLAQVYFGGGSVALATPEGCWHVAKCDPAAALTDGTPNYLGAAALKLAYNSWDSRGGVQVAGWLAGHTYTWEL